MIFKTWLPEYPEIEPAKIEAGSAIHAVEQAASDLFNAGAWEDTATIYPLSVRVSGPGGLDETYEVTLDSVPLFSAHKQFIHGGV